MKLCGPRYKSYTVSISNWNVEEKLIIIIIIIIMSKMTICTTSPGRY